MQPVVISRLKPRMPASGNPPGYLPGTGPLGHVKLIMPHERPESAEEERGLFEFRDFFPNLAANISVPTVFFRRFSKSLQKEFIRLYPHRPFYPILNNSPHQRRLRALNPGQILDVRHSREHTFDSHMLAALFSWSLTSVRNPPCWSHAAFFIHDFLDNSIFKETCIKDVGDNQRIVLMRLQSVDGAYVPHEASFSFRANRFDLRQYWATTDWDLVNATAQLWRDHMQGNHEDSAVLSSFMDFPSMGDLVVGLSLHKHLFPVLRVLMAQLGNLIAMHFTALAHEKNPYAYRKKNLKRKRIDRATLFQRVQQHRLMPRKNRDASLPPLSQRDMQVACLSKCFILCRCSLFFCHPIVVVVN